MRLKSKLHAFTLLECLIALLIISGSALVYQGLTQTLSSNIYYLSSNHQSNWLLFAKQLQSEWEVCQLDRVTSDKVYLKKGNQELAYGLSKRGDFRKTNANNQGYQPMLFGLADCQVREKGGLITVALTFKDGLERTFIYDFKAQS
ncbi:competence type IV pilus minor pilin ComGF [Streptococcus sciuri]|uniref:Competence type IV pilus minor pilin ComGF n=1 Tax=Streptococcus sciuri TaxID=2973939 RepID=A0ABT2FAD4_9STRE|nr:competence type IV pilus minor pilin ComGF [Streptococcus sciuri]MCS4488802.1 competence type IV pilus minor pilin ComGF [Streptococcus sciuri]